MASQFERSLHLDGQREQGEDVRTKNVTAAVAVANVVKTSLGPIGLDKMIVDDVGDVTITNDGATILRLLEVEHPAARVLVELSALQDKEVGDGTTSVVVIAAELLKRANRLVQQGVHPTSIIAGFRLACRESTRYIRDTLATETNALSPETLLAVARTSMSSKIIGAESEYFSQIVVNAMQRVKRENERGKAVYPVKAVNVLKQSGKWAKETLGVDGYALNCTIASEALPKKIEGARIALLDFALHKEKMDMGINIVVTNPDELEAIRRREEDMVKEKIEMILQSGANVILTTKGIDDLCLKYFSNANAMAVRRCLPDDLRQIAYATGATLVPTLANLEGGESFDQSLLGHCDLVEQTAFGDNELILFKGTKAHPCSSIILRGANSAQLDEMERSVHDALCVVKRVLESGRVVAGGGAVEAALSIYLEDFAKSLGSREQPSIAEFAQALLVIPKTLSVNAAVDATDLTAKLRQFHNAAQTDEKKSHLKTYGLDLETGTVRDNINAGVIEPAMGKVKCLRFATEAAVQILRIDDMIRLNPKQREEDPHGH